MVKLTILAVGKGRCALFNREAEGFLVTFDDGTITETQLSVKAFKQMVAMRMAQAAKNTKTAAVPPANNIQQPVQK